MNKFYLILLCTLFFNTVQSQDVIIKTDQSEIKAKVIEILEDKIKYKKWERLDGPVYNISVDDVFMILYKNGDREFFNQQKTTPQTETNTNQNSQTTTAMANIFGGQQQQQAQTPTPTQTPTNTVDNRFYYPDLGRLNIGFGNDGSSEASTFAIGLVASQAFSNVKQESFEIEYGGYGLFSNIEVPGASSNTSIFAFSLALNYGYYLTDQFKISSGLGYYYGFGTVSFESDFGNSEEEVTVNGLYYNVNLDYLFTQNFGINLRYDEVMGLNFGITFSI
jgi:hypothetical protein